MSQIFKGHVHGGRNSNSNAFNSGTVFCIKCFNYLSFVKAGNSMFLFVWQYLVSKFDSGNVWTYVMLFFNFFITRKDKRSCTFFRVYFAGISHQFRIDFPLCRWEQKKYPPILTNDCFLNYSKNLWRST